MTFLFWTLFVPLVLIILLVWYSSAQTNYSNYVDNWTRYLCVMLGFIPVLSWASWLALFIILCNLISDDNHHAKRDYYGNKKYYSTDEFYMKDTKFNRNLFGSHFDEEEVS